MSHLFVVLLLRNTDYYQLHMYLSGIVCKCEFEYPKELLHSEEPLTILTPMDV